jgi:hypothetical protein
LSPTIHFYSNNQTIDVLVFVRVVFVMFAHTLYL